MSRKKFLITSAIALVAFLSGWFLHAIIVRSGKANDDLKTSEFADTLKNAETRKNKMPDDFNTATISGRFIIAQSHCAGFNFIDNTTVLWTNEIACDDPDTLSIRWLDNTTFITKSTTRINQDCAPKIDIYKVLSFDGKHLSLKSAATGWNDSKEEDLEFHQTK